MNICREIGPNTTFLGGLGGSRNYLNHEAFAQARIGVAWQRFTHPTYPQCGGDTFVPGLMSLDALFNCGPAAAELLDKNGIVHDERIAA